MQRILSIARFGMVSIATFLLPACAGHSIIPLDIEKQIDPTLSFDHVKEKPASHQGKVIVLGGEVLDATRLKEHTRLTVLQLPTGRNHEPAMDRTKSKGASLRFRRSFWTRLPSRWHPNHDCRKISGATTELLDEMDYTYPTVTIEFLKVWPEAMQVPPRLGATASLLRLSLLVRRTYWGPYGFYGPYRFIYW